MSELDENIALIGYDNNRRQNFNFAGKRHYDGVDRKTSLYGSESPISLRSRNYTKRIETEYIKRDFEKPPPDYDRIRQDAQTELQQIAEKKRQQRLEKVLEQQRVREQLQYYDPFGKSGAETFHDSRLSSSTKAFGQNGQIESGNNLTTYLSSYNYRSSSKSAQPGLDTKREDRATWNRPSENDRELWNFKEDDSFRNPTQRQQPPSHSLLNSTSNDPSREYAEALRQELETQRRQDFRDTPGQSWDRSPYGSSTQPTGTYTTELQRSPLGENSPDYSTELSRAAEERARFRQLERLREEQTMQRDRLEQGGVELAPRIGWTGVGLQQQQEAGDAATRTHWRTSRDDYPAYSVKDYQACRPNVSRRNSQMKLNHPFRTGFGLETGEISSFSALQQRTPYQMKTPYALHDGEFN